MMAHGPRETDQLPGRLAFHSQSHQECGYLSGGSRAAQDGEHRFVGFGGRQILAGGDLMQEGQEHQSGSTVSLSREISRYHDH